MKPVLFLSDFRPTNYRLRASQFAPELHEVNLVYSRVQERINAHINHGFRKISRSVSVERSRLNACNHPPHSGRTVQVNSLRTVQFSTMYQMLFEASSDGLYVQYSMHIQCNAMCIIAFWKFFTSLRITQDQGQ